MKKTYVTVTGIRPDFIRMSALFKKLDENFNHIMIHTGQHFDKLLSDVFFKDLKIRKPDYNLKVGGINKKHYHQTATASIKLIELLKTIPNVDGVIFLGDSNSVATSVALKKEGYKIIHIEAGMRSGDRRMLEEINRVVCDSISDLLFVYHENYKKNLIKEGICKDKIHVVGNTIVEVIQNIKPQLTGVKSNHILVDIHRPENFLYKSRMNNLLEYLNYYNQTHDIYFLNFPRTVNALRDFNLYTKYEKICKCIPLQGFLDYLNLCRSSSFIISDSGTAQEEPALLDTPVIVPRDYTERPESISNTCSYMLNINHPIKQQSIKNIDKFLKKFKKVKQTNWLGNGTTSKKIIEILSK